MSSSALPARRAGARLTGKTGCSLSPIALPMSSSALPARRAGTRLTGKTGCSLSPIALPMSSSALPARRAGARLMGKTGCSSSANCLRICSRLLSRLVNSSARAGRTANISHKTAQTAGLKKESISVFPRRRHRAAVRCYAVSVENILLIVYKKTAVWQKTAC
ncbi:Uncharacterised protein [Neisseria meningitidis]|nr:Uncharacterised protein [Neisseria meningitidis]